MGVYANENDPQAAHWLTCLPLRLDCVDRRSIKEVVADDVREFTQCHFFAGIGGWPLALEMAGWPDAAPVWTGSCPCQPFSVAGKGKGVADERHLWPEFLRLIDQCRPATIFGEQVASQAGRDWLATVRADLEAVGYAVGGADLCAASVGAPHIRQRLFWVAYADGGQSRDRNVQCSRQYRFQSQGGGVDASSRLANTASQGPQGSEHSGESFDAQQPTLERSGETSGVGDTDSERQSTIRSFSKRARTDCARSPWDDVEYIPCCDGKARPVKPGLRLLAHGIPGRVAQLRGLGNAIVPQVAAQFIAACMEAIG